MSISMNAIKQFVAAWYLALDNHAPTEELASLVTDDVQMIFPEATLPGIADFKAWYSGGKYANGTEAPGVINIFFDENHNVVSVERTGGSDGAPGPKVGGAWRAGATRRGGSRGWWRGRRAGS